MQMLDLLEILMYRWLQVTFAFLEAVSTFTRRIADLSKDSQWPWNESLFILWLKRLVWSLKALAKVRIDISLSTELLKDHEEVVLRIVLESSTSAVTKNIDASGVELGRRVQSCSFGSHDDSRRVGQSLQIGWWFAVVHFRNRSKWTIAQWPADRVKSFPSWFQSFDELCYLIKPYFFISMLFGLV